MIQPNIKSGENDVGFNMTPLIDIVFLLIIFFLVAANLNQQETQLTMELPRAKSGDEMREPSVKRIILNLPSDGQLFVGGTPIQTAELPIFFKKLTAAHEIEVHLRANRLVPYRAIEPILLACAESGIWNVSFSVIQ